MKRILIAYCGAGGDAMGYHRAGFEVVTWVTERKSLTEAIPPAYGQYIGERLLEIL